MRILVCIKYVPDPETLNASDLPPGRFEDGEVGLPGGQINRCDEYAIEAALRLRETCGASRIDALTVGARGTEEVLRRAIGMGADHGVHIHQAYQAFPSPFTIGGLIAAYAQGKAYDLILCGAMSADLMQGLVGPVLAGLMRRPCLTSVHTLDYSTMTGRLRCAREVEGGRHETWELALPALVSIQSGIHPPRYPALSKLLRANRYPLEIAPSDSQVNTVARQRICATRMPVKTRAGDLLKGSAEEKARKLASRLRARGRH